MSKLVAGAKAVVYTVLNASCAEHHLANVRAAYQWGKATPMEASYTPTTALAVTLLCYL